MTGLKTIVWGTLLVLALPFTAVAADDTKADEPKPERRRGEGLRERLGQLLPPGAEKKLNLTDEQKEKIAKLQDQFREKARETLGKGQEGLEKLREAIQKARQDNDNEALGELRRKAETQMEGFRKLRGEFEGKVLALLNDEQKKQLEDLKKDQPRPGGREGRPRGGEGRGPGEVMGPLFMPMVQDRLNLTDEQKEKLAQVRKDAESKALAVLTEEQKKKYQELKEEFRSRFGGGRERPGAGRRGRDRDRPEDKTSEDKKKESKDQ